MGKLAPKKGFANISSQSMLPEDSYRFRIFEVDEDTPTRKNNLKQVIVKSKVDDPDHPEVNGREFWDFVVLEKQDGTDNDAGWGRMMAYAEAVLGMDEDELKAEDSEGYDVQDLVNGEFIGVIKHRTYEKDEGGQGTSANLKKVLPAD